MGNKYLKMVAFRRNCLFWLVGITGIVLDQLTKYWVVHSFNQVNDTIPLWPNVFHFTYIFYFFIIFLFEGMII